MIFVDTEGQPTEERAEEKFAQFHKTYPSAVIEAVNDNMLLAWHENRQHQHWKGVALIKHPKKELEHYRNMHLLAIPGAYTYAREALLSLVRRSRPAIGHFLKTQEGLRPIILTRSTDEIQLGVVPRLYAAISPCGEVSYSGSCGAVVKAKNPTMAGKAEAIFWFFRPDQPPGAHMGITMSGLVPIWKLQD